jgi:hypothetical protein
MSLLAQRLINMRFAVNAHKRGTGLNLSLPIFERKVAKDEARLILAIESASRVLDGRSNVFDEERMFASICASLLIRLLLLVAS